MAQGAHPFVVGQGVKISPQARYLRGDAAIAKASSAKLVITSLGPNRLGGRAGGEDPYALVSSENNPPFRIAAKKLVQLSEGRDAVPSEVIHPGYKSMMNEFSCSPSDLFKTPPEVKHFASKQLKEDVFAWADPTPIDPRFLAPNALNIDWKYECKKVYLNPPRFTQTEVFIDKAHLEIEDATLSKRSSAGAV